MSTIDTINNAQQSLSTLNASNNMAQQGGAAAFNKALELAMDNKNLALPSGASAAVDATSLLLEEKGVVSAAANIASMQGNLEDVFGGLSTDIASTFVAALAGEDSATTVKPELPEETLEELKTLAKKLAKDAIAEGHLIGGDDIDGAKKLATTIAPYLDEEQENAIAAAALAALEDSLLEQSDEEAQS